MKQRTIYTTLFLIAATLFIIFYTGLLDITSDNHTVTLYGHTWTLTGPFGAHGYECYVRNQLRTMYTYDMTNSTLRINGDLPNTAGYSCTQYMDSHTIRLESVNLCDYDSATITRTLTASVTGKRRSSITTSVMGLDKTYTDGATATTNAGTISIHNDGHNIIIESTEGKQVLSCNTPQHFTTSIGMTCDDQECLGGTYDLQITGLTLQKNNHIVTTNTPTANTTTTNHNTSLWEQLLNWIKKLLRW